MEFKIPVSSRINELVSSGVITIGVHITRDGQEVYARCTQPHPRLGINSYTAMTLDDAENLLAKVETRVKKAFEVRSKIEPVQAGSFRSTNEYFGYKSIGEASDYARRNLMFAEKDGLKNSLPKDSLSPLDFNRVPKHVFARACSVADVVGTHRLVSRINSDRVNLGQNGTATLKEWWEGATPTQRFVLLTRSKVFPKDRDGSTRIHKNWLDTLELLPCPFRDAEAQVGQPEEGPSAEEPEYTSESSVDWPSRKGEGVSIRY